LGREFENLRGEVQAGKDSTCGEIGKLKSETERVATSVSGLETLRPAFDELTLSLQRLQPVFPGMAPLLKSAPLFASPSPFPPPKAPKKDNESEVAGVTLNV
jgi:hypothetical protein